MMLANGLVESVVTSRYFEPGLSRAAGSATGRLPNGEVSESGLRSTPGERVYLRVPWVQIPPSPPPPILFHIEHLQTAPSIEHRR